MVTLLFATIVPNASAADPTPTPLPDPVDQGDTGVLAETPQPCGTAGPGQISIGFLTDMNAVVIDASAFETSDLYLETSTEPGTPTPQVVINDATHSEGGGYVLINDDAVGATQSSPSIAVSATGEVIVVWADRRNNKEHIYSARLPAGSSTWSADIKVTSDQTKVKTVPSVAIGSNGTAYVLWQQTANKNGIWFSSLPLGSTTWGSAAQINDTSKDQINPRIAVDTAGRLLAVYSEGTTAVWARTRPGGSSTWSTAVMVSTSTPGSARTPAVSIRGNGVGYVAWTTNAGVMWGVRFDPVTTTWGSQTQLSASGVYARPAVAMTSTLGIAAGEVGSGTAANLRAYPATVP